MTLLTRAAKVLALSLTVGSVPGIAAATPEDQRPGTAGVEAPAGPPPTANAQPASPPHPMDGRPWRGLAVVDVAGRTGTTRYTVSSADVDPLSAVGDHDHVHSSGVTLRLEWASTADNVSGTKATDAYVEIKGPGGGGQHGWTDWHCPVNRAASGLCTRRVHLDNDPLDGNFGAPRYEGDLEVYLHVQKKDQRGVTVWEADSRGAVGGSRPRRTTHVRGIVHAPLGGAGHLLGTHIGTDLDHSYDDLSCPEAEQRLGEDLGRRPAAVRMYYEWQIPHPLHSCVAKAFRTAVLPVVSHKPGPGGWKAWAQNTASGPTIRQLARWYKQFDREFVMIFHHEPHDDMNSTTNTAAHYRQAQKTAKRIFDEEGTKVIWGYSFTSKALAGSPSGSADPLYAGDTTVDLEMYDGYNWYAYHRAPWRSFAEIYKVAVATGKRRGNLVMPGEYGSHPSADGHSRDQWFRDAAHWIKTNPDVRRVMIGAVMYHSDHVDHHGRSHWTIDRTTAGGWSGYRDAYVANTAHNGYDADYFKSEPFLLR
jgi:hypothetical protein